VRTATPFSSSSSTPPDPIRLHERHASRAATKRFSCSITGAGQPRRVAISGPIRSDGPSIATVAEKRLQPVLPATCCGVSKVMAGTDEGEASAPWGGAPSARRHVVPTSAAAGSAVAFGVGAAAGASLGLAPEPATAAAGVGVVFAHAAPTAMKTSQDAIVLMTPILPETPADNPAAFEMEEET
jgi:hypothetical protein